MIGWTQDSKPMQLGAALTKEQKEAANKPAYSFSAATTDGVMYFSAVAPSVGMLVEVWPIEVAEWEFDALAGTLTASD